MLIVGGEGLSGVSTGGLDTAEIYDPAHQTFTLYITDKLNYGRVNYAATLLDDGRVLIAGGYFYGGASNPCEEIFDPATQPPRNSYKFHLFRKMPMVLH